MTLEIPQSILLPDGTSGLVRGVTAKISDGRVDQIVYTVEKASGAWMDLASDAILTQHPLS